MIYRPIRVQLRRTKGWRMPENTVKVDRTSRHGNQFVIVEYDDRFAITRFPDDLRFGIDRNEDASFADDLASARAEAVRRYREWLLSDWGNFHREQKVQDLRGKNLACWCPPDQPCHADVLLEVANG